MKEVYRIFTVISCFVLMFSRGHLYLLVKMGNLVSVNLVPRAAILLTSAKDLQALEETDFS